MNFRLGQSTISGIIKDTCRASKIIFQELYLKIPDSEDAWKIVAHDFVGETFHIVLEPWMANTAALIHP